MKDFVNQKDVLKCQHQYFRQTVKLNFQGILQAGGKQKFITKKS